MSAPRHRLRGSISRGRAALHAALRLAADPEGWAAWTEVRDTFRARYPVAHRREQTPDRIREATKRALSRGLACLADDIEIEHRASGDRLRLKREPGP